MSMRFFHQIHLDQNEYKMTLQRKQDTESRDNIVIKEYDRFAVKHSERIDS